MSGKAELGTGNMTWGCVSSYLPPAPQALGPVVTLDTGQSWWGSVLTSLDVDAEQLSRLHNWALPLAHSRKVHMEFMLEGGVLCYIC